MPSRALALTLLAVAPAACGGHRDRVTAGRGDGIRYAIPAGWHVAPRSLTPHLVNPREVLTAGTGPLPAGGACAQNPGAALAAMGPADVLVTVRERFGSVRSTPSRPRRFTLPRAERGEAQDCAGRGASFVTHYLSFRAGGRGFDVIVAVGRAAPPARVRQALSLLDSLSFSARAHKSADSVRACPPAASSPPSC